MSLSDTPRANRLHVAIFGKRNSGKSSLINAITNQEIATVSEVAGTTTDPVYKSMEIHGVGPCVFIDTAGFDDEGYLGEKRIEKTKEVLSKTDIAIVVFTDKNIGFELSWIEELRNKGIPIISLINKADILENIDDTASYIKKKCGIVPLKVSAKNNENIDCIKEEILRLLPKDYESESITGKLVKKGDLVLLVMPQDIQAPKGRLILPQVQTIRDLLDNYCIVVSTTTDMIENTLASLSRAPELIITDSQVFKTVYEKKPKESRLTSFSVLFAAYKGDINYFVESAAAIDTLTEDSKVLIAEACTHAPLTEDIGREKIPKMLRKKIGKNLKIEIVSGVNFPKDLSSYDLIIHCGACMFNRKYVLSRVSEARRSKVAMCNYGVVIAYLSNILDKIDY